MRLGLIVAVTLLAGASLAQAQEKKVVIAIYAPNAPFASGTDRYNFVNRLAQQVSSVTGLTAEGKAFARAAEFEAAVKSKQVQFAVVDGVYLAQRGVPWTVLAMATTGGETQPKWGLFVSSAPDVRSLEGKGKLAVAATGTRDDEFVGNALCDGEIQVKKFFAGKATAPDVASAVQSVKLRKADAVFAPESQGQGLTKIFDAGRIPNAALCDVGSGLGSDVVSKVKSAVLSHGASAALDGWKPADAGPYRALAANLSSRSKRPVMYEPEVVRLDLDVLQPPGIEPGLPDLKNQFWNP